jgi:hypothetical protein
VAGNSSRCSHQRNGNKNCPRLWAKPYTVKVADALIATTALLTGYELFTYNVKDFRYIPGIKLYDFA